MGLSRRLFTKQFKLAAVRRLEQGVSIAEAAGVGDRFFEGVLAAHRGATDAAGTDWKSAVYRKVEEEVKAGRGLTIERMVELGQVSRSGFYRFVDGANPRPDP